MKLFLSVLLIPFAFLWGQSYSEIIRQIDRAPKLHGARQMARAAEELARAAEGVRYPTLTASIRGVWLRETPGATFRLPPFFRPMSVPMATKRHFEGALTLRYPLFTGFALDASVDKARWQARKARLKVLDLQRNLYLGATRLFSGILAARYTLDALRKARTATDAAYRKARGFYRQGLIPLADLYAIRAKKYDLDALIIQARSRERMLRNRLSALVGRPVDSVRLSSKRPVRLNRRRLLAAALEGREDIRALEAGLGMSAQEIRLARSRFFPTVGLAASLKRQGDSLRLAGDGHRNADESYLGIQVDWNLFDGGKDLHTLQAARLKHLSEVTALQDYRQQVRTEVENGFLQLRSIEARIRSARALVAAKKQYYSLIRGRYDNQLASADELSRAIADLAAARAKLGALRARRFAQRRILLLLSGLRTFHRRLGL